MRENAETVPVPEHSGVHVKQEEAPASCGGETKSTVLLTTVCGREKSLSLVFMRAIKLWHSGVFACALVQAVTGASLDGRHIKSTRRWSHFAGM